MSVMSPTSRPTAPWHGAKPTDDGPHHHHVGRQQVDRGKAIAAGTALELAVPRHSARGAATPECSVRHRDPATDRTAVTPRLVGALANIGRVAWKTQPTAPQHHEQKGQRGAGDATHASAALSGLGGNVQ